MEKVEKIVKELNYNLEFLEKETENVLEKAEEGIKVTQRALEHIRDIILKQRILRIQEA